MKKIAIMQPYFFPYLGYFQLISAVDEFVIYDDVQWIKGGWINRNRIIGENEPEYITLPIKKDSYTIKINERYFSDLVEKAKKDILERLEETYASAPYFYSTYEFVKSCFEEKETNAAKFIESTLRKTCSNLGIKTQIIRSSSLTIKSELRAQDRVIEINKILGSDNYINVIGGKELYDNDTFERQGISLNFLQPHLEEYNQGIGDFIRGLSILDVMMFNSPKKIKEMLNDYELI